MMKLKERENFGSRAAVIFAMAGSAIGLGNIWRFPYMVGEHGGAAFVILYIASSLLISLPIFFSEVTVGRRSRCGAFSAMSTLQPGKKIWKFFGAFAILIPTFIACYYSVVGGWSLNFLLKSFAGEFVKTDPAAVNSIFPAFVASGWAPVVFHLLFMGITAVIVACGVKSGIELFSKISIPVLFFLILMIATYSISLPGSEDGVNYLVRPDFKGLEPRDFAYAMGQSFFSLSVGAGAVITYGSYVSKNENILLSGGGTALFDLIFATLAAFAIMPAVFAAGIEPSCGPGLVYQSVPYIFASFAKELPLVSAIVSVLFFFTIVIAAMTSLVSLLEVGVSFLIEHVGLKRWKASLLLSGICGAVGCVCALSDKIFSTFDWLSSNIFMPTMAMAVVIFVGYVMKQEDVRDELTNGGVKRANGRLFPIVYFLIRFVAPAAIVVLFVTNFIL